MAETDEPKEGNDFAHEGDTGEITPEIQAQIEMDERADLARKEGLKAASGVDTRVNTTLHSEAYNAKDITTWTVPPERVLPTEKLPQDGYHIQLNPGHAFTLGELGLLSDEDVYEVYDSDSPHYKQRVAVLDIRTLISRVRAHADPSVLHKLIYFIQQENVQSTNISTALGALESVGRIESQLESDDYRRRMELKLAFIRPQIDQSLILAAASESFIELLPAEMRTEQIEQELAGLRTLIQRNYLEGDDSLTQERRRIFELITQTTPHDWVENYRKQFPVTQP